MFERKFDYEYIVYLRKLGLSVTEIAKIVGCHLLTVRRAVEKVKLDLECQRQLLSNAYENSKA